MRSIRFAAAVPAILAVLSTAPALAQYSDNAVGRGEWYWNRSAPVQTAPVQPSVERAPLPSIDQDAYRRAYEQGRLDAIRDLDMGASRPPAGTSPRPSAYGPSSRDLADENWAGLRANWTRTRFEIARRWPKLTDYDLDQIAGDRNELLNRIQDRYGISNERADEQVATWQRTRGG